MPTIKEIRKLLKDESTISNGQDTDKQFFLVTVNEANATPYQMKWLTGTSNGYTLPAYFSGNPDNPYLWVIGKSAKRANGTDGKLPLQTWEIQVDYGLPQVVGQTSN